MDWDEINIEPIERPFESSDGIVARETPDVSKDWTSYFKTDIVFESRESVKQWLLEKGREHNIAIVVGKSDLTSGRAARVFYQCERSGVYKKLVKQEEKIEKSGEAKRTGTKKCDCPFKIKATNIVGEKNHWIVDVICGLHNHPLASYIEGHVCHAKLTIEEKELFVDLTKGGVKPKAALSILKDRNPDNSTSLQTLYNVKKKVKKEVMDDRSILQQLMMLGDQRDYILLNRHDENGVIMNLFFAHPDSIALAKCFPYVFVMDSTYKTNLHKWPLFEIVGVTFTLKTFSVAYCFMEHETMENFQWTLERFRELLNEDQVPLTMVTDRDLALMNALEIVFPESNHLLCRWHIKMGVEKKGKVILVNDSENLLKTQWREMWDKVTHSPTEEEYEANLHAWEHEWREWPELYAYVINKWITYKKKFVSAWTDKVFNIGNTQTSRVESAHSMLKDWLRKSSRNTFLTTFEMIHKSIDVQISELHL